MAKSHKLSVQQSSVETRPAVVATHISPDQVTDEQKAAALESQAFNISDYFNQLMDAGADSDVFKKLKDLGEKPLIERGLIRLTKILTFLADNKTIDPEIDRVVPQALFSAAKEFPDNFSERLKVFEEIDAAHKHLHPNKVPGSGAQPFSKRLRNFIDDAIEGHRLLPALMAACMGTNPAAILEVAGWSVTTPSLNPIPETGVRKKGRIAAALGHGKYGTFNLGETAGEGHALVSKLAYAALKAHFPDFYVPDEKALPPRHWQEHGQNEKPPAPIIPMNRDNRKRKQA